MGLLRKEGFLFSFDPEACMHCPGRCCRGKTGHIWINDQELQEICRFLGMNRIDVMRQFVDLVNNRMSIRERYMDGSYDCIFFNVRENRCSVYGARPAQCRRFPFWDGYKGRIDELVVECPGIRREKK